MVVPQVVKVQQGGYSVAKDIKNTGETIKVQQGGYSVAQGSQQSQTSSNQVYDSAGRILPSAIKNDPNIQGDMVYIQKGNSRILKSYYSKDAQDYLKQKYSQQKTTQPVAQPTPTVKVQQGGYSVAQTKQPTVTPQYPTIVAGSSIKSTAQTQPVQQQTVIKKVEQPTVTPAKAPTIQSQRVGVASAGANQPIPTAQTLKGSYYNASKSNIPSVVNPSYVPTYVREQQATGKVTPNKQIEYPFMSLEQYNNDVYIQPKNTLPNNQLYPTYNTGKTSIETVKIAVKEKNVLDRINTGVAKTFNPVYNEIVSNEGLNKYNDVYKKTVGKAVPLGTVVTPKFAANAAVGSVEGVVTTIPSTASLVKGLATSPIVTIKDTAKGTVELAKTNPGRLTGNVVGSSVAMGGVGKVAAPIKGKIKTSVTEKVPIPAIEKSYISFVEKPGADALYSRVKIGESITVKGEPIYSSPTTIIGGAAKSVKEKVTGKQVTGIKKGGLSAPDDLIQGKQMTAFGKLETSNFINTVERVSPDIDYFKAGKEITDSVYSTKNPVFKADKFTITAKDIPEQARPMVAKSITEYKGKIIVKGSESQKAQIKQYMTREPGDIEIYVDNPVKYVSKSLEPRLKESGVKYEISDKTGSKPKVTFFDDSGKPMKGIEIFPHEPKLNKKIDVTDMVGVEGYATEFYQHPKNIQYGYKPLPPIEVGGKGFFKTGSIKMMDVREQAARKFSGATTFKDGQIELTHPGRIKDVRDLVDIGTGYALEKNPSIEPSIVTYTSKAVDKYPQLMDEPLVSFIDINKRLPTKQEFGNIQLKNTEIGINKQKVDNIISLRSPKVPSVTEIRMNFDNMFGDFRASETASISLVGNVDNVHNVPLIKTMPVNDVISTKPIKTDVSYKRTPVKLIAENIKYTKSGKLYEYDTLYENIYTPPRPVIGYPVIQPIKPVVVSPSYPSITTVKTRPPRFNAPSVKPPNPKTVKEVVYTFNNDVYPIVPSRSSGTKVPIVKHPIVKPFKPNKPNDDGYMNIKPGNKNNYPTPAPTVDYPSSKPTKPNYPPYPTYPDYPTYPIFKPPVTSTSTSPFKPIITSKKPPKEDYPIFPPYNPPILKFKKNKPIEYENPYKSKKFQWFIANPLNEVIDYKKLKRLQNDKGPW